MPRISGAGGVEPQEGDRRPQLANPAKDHIKLMSANQSLSHVVEALKPLVTLSQSSRSQLTKSPTSAQSLHVERLDELKRELQVLEQMSTLIQEKPSDYEFQIQQFLRPGESIADAEEGVPREIIEIQEKMRAVATANILIEEANSSLKK